MYGDIYSDAIHFEGYHGELPNLSGVRDIKNMFWSLEFNGHPAQLMTDAYGHLIDQSIMAGFCFQQRFLFDFTNYHGADGCLCGYR